MNSMAPKALRMVEAAQKAKTASSIFVHDGAERNVEESISSSTGCETAIRNAIVCPEAGSAGISRLNTVLLSKA
jgi:hypothetical protein